MIQSRITSATARALDLLHSAQVEYQGQYSIHRLRTLQDYTKNRFTTSRLAALLFVTPLPSIAIIVLIELAPFNAPSAGPQHNTVFWARYAVVNILQGLCYISITRVRVRKFDLTFLQALCASVCATVAAEATAYACAIGIGFPVPFTFPITSIPWFVTAWTMFGIFSFRRIFADPAAVLTLKEWLYVTSLISLQFFVYPLFNYVFCLASPLGQTALSVALGGLKIFFRYASGKAIKQQTDDHAEIVTFSAEMGYAVFVAFSMQNATSIMTIVVLLIIDLLHSCSVIYEVNIVVQRLETLDRKICSEEKHSHQDYSVVDRAISLISETATSEIKLVSLRQSSNDGSSNCNRWDCLHFQRPAWKSTKVHAAVAPVAAALMEAKNLTSAFVTHNTPQQPSTSAAKIEYITTLRLLHLTEFTMLGELVEFVVPIVYCAFHPLVVFVDVPLMPLMFLTASYMVAMVHLPNRVYCSQLASVTADNVAWMALRMLSYGLLELISLILIDRILRTRLRFSPVAQLAMVLDTHWTSVQGAIIVWVLFTVQGLLEHFGQSITIAC